VVPSPGLGPRALDAEKMPASEHAANAWDRTRWQPTGVKPSSTPDPAAAPAKVVHLGGGLAVEVVGAVLVAKALCRRLAEALLLHVVADPGLQRRAGTGCEVAGLRDVST
jgi:hypothetical protein